MPHRRLQLAISLVVLLPVLSAAPLLTSLAAAEPVVWSGQGGYRVLVEVAPVDLAGRDRDELPAEVEIDWMKLLAEWAEDRVVDTATLQVVRYDKRTGKPVSDGKYAYGSSDAERPFRWYDASIPYEFPEVVEDVSRTGGELRRRPTVRGGYFFNAIGDWKRGRLAWLHFQEADSASSYAVYFDLLPRGARPSRVPPRGWIGDGLPRCDRQQSLPRPRQ